MPRDFAKSPRRKRASAPSRKVPGWLWLATGIMICALVGGLYKLQARHEQAAIARGALPGVPADAKALPKKVLPPPPSPKWTYHEVLKDKTVEIPPEALPVADPNAPPLNYVLACGTFASRDNAEALKARMALTGLRVIVKPVPRGLETHWWVGIDHYTSKRAAQNDQHIARDNGIQGCRIL